MKVFVYEKKTSKKVGTFKNVTNAVEFPDKRMMLVTKSGDIIEFDTRIVKITLYQN